MKHGNKHYLYFIGGPMDSHKWELDALPKAEYEFGVPNKDMIEMVKNGGLVQTTELAEKRIKYKRLQLITVIDGTFHWVIGYHKVNGHA